MTDSLHVTAGDVVGSGQDVVAPAVGVLLVAVVLTALVAAFAVNRRRMRKFGLSKLPQCITVRWGNTVTQRAPARQPHHILHNCMHASLLIVAILYVPVPFSSHLCEIVCNSHFQASSFTLSRVQRGTAL